MKGHVGRFKIGFRIEFVSSGLKFYSPENVSWLFIDQRINFVCINGGIVSFMDIKIPVHTVETIYKRTYETSYKTFHFHEFFAHRTLDGERSICFRKNLLLNSYFLLIYILNLNKFIISVTMSIYGYIFCDKENQFWGLS